MTPIRILLGCNHGALRAAIAEQRDMKVVGEVRRPLELLLAAGEVSADVVVLTLQDGRDPGVSSLLLEQYPEITVLGMTPDGDAAYIAQLCPTHFAVHATEPASLLGAIRRAVRQPCKGAGDDADPAAAAGRPHAGGLR